MSRAACKGMAYSFKKNDSGDPVDIFFPSRGGDKMAGPMTCFHCPVTKECDSFGDLIGAKSGVWGGKNRT